MISEYEFFGVLPFTKPPDEPQPACQSESVPKRDFVPERDADANSDASIRCGE